MDKAELKAFRNEVRKANRRIERATPGQRRALEYWVKKYSGGEIRFSAATKGKSKEELNKIKNQLQRFLNAPSTTRKGWDAIKAQQVKSANKTFGKRGYTITDDELANILEEVEGNHSYDMYRAVNLVQAEKEKQGNLWKGTPEEIQAVLIQKLTSQEALKTVLKARERKK